MASVAVADFVELGIADRPSWLGEVVCETLPQRFGPTSNLGPISPKHLRVGFVENTYGVCCGHALGDLAKLCERDEELTAETVVVAWVGHATNVPRVVRFQRDA
jgi:hypothetical protein